MHNLAPASADLVSSQVLKTILSEGRKFGVAVGLISQRPGKLDADVLSQCMTQFILRIVNPVDQARVAESVESVGCDLLKELPALSKGQAIIAADRVPDELKDARLVELPTAGLVAGTKYRGQFEERLLGLVDEVKRGGGRGWLA
jgi:DNA helicase HerA-like ATPase